MIICRVCNQTFRSLSQTHLAKHNLTPAKYSELYGERTVSKDTISRMSRYDASLFLNVGLGEKPDSVIGKSLGIERRVVCYIRKRLGIPAFGGLVLTQEGVPCRSVFEAMYDAWLHWKGVEHLHTPNVPGLPYIADFLVGGTFVEIAGMIDFKRYAERANRKRSDYDRLSVPYRWVLPEEVENLYADCPVALLFRESRCSACDCVTTAPIRGMCRPCARKEWGIKNATAKVCDQCKKPTMMPAGSNNRFCSRKCYWKSLEANVPPAEEILRLAETMSIRQVAIKLGVKATLLYMRIHRFKKRQPA